MRSAWHPTRASGIAWTRVRRVMWPVSRDLDLTRLVIPTWESFNSEEVVLLPEQPPARRSLGELSTDAPSEGAALEQVQLPGSSRRWHKNEVVTELRTGHSARDDKLMKSASSATRLR